MLFAAILDTVAASDVSILDASAEVLETMLGELLDLPCCIPLLSSAAATPLYRRKGGSGTQNVTVLHILPAVSELQ